MAKAVSRWLVCVEDLACLHAGAYTGHDTVGERGDDVRGLALHQRGVTGH